MKLLFFFTGESVLFFLGEVEFAAQAVGFEAWEAAVEEPPEEEEAGGGLEEGQVEGWCRVAVDDVEGCVEGVGDLGQECMLDLEGGGFVVADEDGDQSGRGEGRGGPRDKATEDVSRWRRRS